MGLGGRKQKQRIGEDPRNQKWALDASRTSYKLLTSMGWSSNSDELNRSRTYKSGFKRRPIVPKARSNDPSHANLGLGAAPGQSITHGGLWDTSGRVRLMGLIEGMGWVRGQGLRSTINGEEYAIKEPKKTVQGGEFGRLLERLNSKKRKKEDLDKEAVESAAPVLSQEEPNLARAEEESEEPLRKKRKKEKKEKKSGSSKREVSTVKEDEEKKPETQTDSVTVSSSTIPTPPDSHQPSPAPPPPQHRLAIASRSRNVAAKRRAAQDANAMREILGLPPLPVETQGGARTETAEVKEELAENIAETEDGEKRTEKRGKSAKSENAGVQVEESVTTASDKKQEKRKKKREKENTEAKIGSAVDDTEERVSKKKTKRRSETA
ncbi:hypothetical protein BT69DRAFT_1283728 [Atractiella rhizophila]|nr:hypothetical protein BT69DRAFT_1283728 [Atractiella rhizophila]